ncbi:hypothetical protein [Pectobacterium parmentieri]|uniref:Uncharacterized protein n=1 Tax=Pectobacterium parmentieri TaxID=1905730 RepID=A0A8B3FUC0_PECPM|nr:hypothetical protein [Pectobacterium parmentieri]AOR58817.1 hypothetical protein A8F97_07835 [Pectobacterium parmentieri]AYH10148.1 hypothetical protein C5E24_10875 [Pectobacterium parmentieri]AYH19141.1 hypothetical protein C5E22_11915 [Pectobacterium parmentieri]AYH36467.1 hypothetical protein C5E17_10820 [Pectobacterium parmentieri]AZS56573.1 hypothetical protein C5E18_10820 [Pectobacterium parmentieri]
MGKGGGGSTEVKETSQQAAAAGVARQQWDLYQNELKPYENLFMDKVEGLNDQQKYDGIAGDVNLGYQQQFGQARRQAADGLASIGVDPSSGKFQSTLKDVATDQVAGSIDATNRSQTDQQNKYVAGLQDVQAMGAGQKAEAMQGYQGIAAASQQKAISDAQSSLSKQQASKGLIGTIGGALVSQGLSSLPKSTPTPTGGSSSGVFGVSDTPFMSTNFRNIGG